MDVSVHRLIESIKPGETALLEYLPSYIPEFTLLKLMEYSEEKKIPLIIDDNFDTLPIIAAHIENLGIKVDFSRVYVVKTGGRINVGNVVARVPFHPDLRVYIENYGRAASKVSERFSDAINLVLGLENFLKLPSSPLDIYLTIWILQRFLGNTRRRAFYLLNRKILESISPVVYSEVRRVASTVVEMVPYPMGAILRFVKSTNVDLLGEEVKVDIGGEL
ncbi:DUF257 family protein [Thermococcus waiotapuensis]|uniref:DUF257 family protein n=1 Tax=Thermococcus waiotapuensis TaxID=90909 RepID=A0AAE4T2Q3_9EURY|nr:DUF257 family protein [Thermococcus waiotapuensis]MDV3103043.1 DUF257 family protein [Thermococcus waiotapuensis]